MTKPKPGARHGPFHCTYRVHWIADFARRERVRQGLTQVVLSKKIGFPSKHLSGYETGFYTIRAVYALERVLDGLGYELHIRKKGSRDESIQKHIS